MQIYKRDYVKFVRSVNLLWIYALLFSLFTSCKDTGSNEEGGIYDPNAPVEVNSIVPAVGTISLPLVIHGGNFGADKSKTKVFFDNVEAVIITIKNNHLYVLAPRLSEGEHTVKVVVDGKEGVLSSKFVYHVTSSVSTIAGTGESAMVDGDILQAQFDSPDYISVDNRRNLLVTDDGHYALRLVSLEDNKVTTLLKNAQQLYGSCFSSDYSHFYLARETSTQLGYDFDCNSNWVSVAINDPDFKNYSATVAADKIGNLYFIGCKGSIIKKDINTGNITKIGEIPTIYYNSEDDFYSAYNPIDNYIYICAPKKHVIFRVNVGKSKFVEADFETYTGVRGSYGANNGPRLEATYNTPKGIAFDSDGNMYVADSSNNLIRKVSVDGMVSTLTGKSTGGYKDGSLDEALFRSPRAIAIDPDNFIYVADYSNYRIRCIAIQ